MHAGGWLRRGRGGEGSGAAAGAPQQPPDPLVPGDGWSRAVLESGALRHNRGERGAGLVRLLSLSAGPRPTLDKGWGAAVNLLGSADKSVLPILRALLQALATAPPSTARPGGEIDARPILVSRENAVAAVNTVWAASHVLGAAAVTDLGATLGRLLEEPWTAESSSLRDACAGALAAVGTEEAFEELKAAVPRAQTKAQRELLLLCISRMPGAARSAGTAEVAVATHGLDVGGRRDLTAHHRSYLLTLNANGSVETRSIEGETAVGNEAAERVLRAEVRAIGTTYRKEVARLEALLATEHSWTPAQWRRLYLGHPITRAVASHLIWRLELDSGASADVIPSWQPAGLLRVLPHIAGARAHFGTAGSIGDASGTGYGTPLPDNVRAVRLWHPCEAAPEELALWRATLRVLSAQQQFDQPFQQVERAFTSVTRDAEQAELHQLAGAERDAAAWQADLDELPWTALSKAGGKTADREDLIHREFPDDKVTATALFTRIALTARRPALIRLGAAWIHRTDDRTLTPLPWSALHPRLCSEVERDLSVLMTPPADAAADDPAGDLRTRNPLAPADRL